MENRVNYALFHSDTMGYAIFHAIRTESGAFMCWQQITIWYWYKGNLYRYNPEYRDMPMRHYHTE